MISLSQAPLSYVSFSAYTWCPCLKPCRATSRFLLTRGVLVSSPAELRLASCLHVVSLSQALPSYVSLPAYTWCPCLKPCRATSRFLLTRGVLVSSPAELRLASCLHVVSLSQALLSYVSLPAYTWCPCLKPCRATSRFLLTRGVLVSSPAELRLASCLHVVSLSQAPLSYVSLPAYTWCPCLKPCRATSRFLLTRGVLVSSPAELRLASCLHVVSLSQAPLSYVSLPAYTWCPCLKPC